MKNLLKKSGKAYRDGGSPLLLKRIIRYIIAHSSPNAAQISEHSDIADSSTLKWGVKITNNVQIKENTVVNRNTTIQGPAEIGKFCAIANDVQIQGSNHDLEKPALQVRFYKDELGLNQSKEAKGVKIGNDVWIGTKSVILPGVEVGHGAVIGAGSIVTKDVAPYEIVAGTPAESIGWRFSEETRKFMLDIKWWDKEIEELKNKKKFFDSNIKEKNVNDLRNLYYD